MNRDRIIIPHERIVHAYEDRTFFNEENALAQLLLDDVCFLNDGHFDDEKTVCVFVNCSDIFAWGFADAENVLSSELQALYEAHMADPAWGAAKWTIRKRGEMPQGPVVEAMKKAGVWDFAEGDLRPNTTDAETQSLFAQAAAQQRAQEASSAANAGIHAEQQDEGRRSPEGDSARSP